MIIRLISCDADNTYGKTTRWTNKVVLSQGRKCSRSSASLLSKPWLKQGPCSVKSVLNLAKKFEETGWTRGRPRFGPPRVHAEVVAEVHNTITTSPLHTVRSVSAHCYANVSLSMTAHPDVGTWRQQQRLYFAIFSLIRYDEDSRWPLRILWTDEAHFILTGNVYSKNCVHWVEENPHCVVLVPSYDRYMTVRCGVAKTFILGSYFFADVTSSDMQTCFITGAQYKAMLENYVIPGLQQ